MKRAIDVAKTFLNAFPKWFGLYLALSGLITFNLFILEEAFQTCMFGSWPAQSAKEWQLVKRNLATMEKIQGTLIFMNYAAGWINPIAFVAYDAYAKSEQEYMDGMKSLIFANAPELFDGEKVTFRFIPGEVEYEDGYMKMRNSIVTVFARANTPVITGTVKVDGDNVIVDAR